MIDYLDKFGDLIKEFGGWIFTQIYGDPTGAIAVCIFILALFTFKPTRMYAIGSVLLYLIIL
ncbi:hypothetical protein [Niallia circulans]|uniref:Uncharacterized protein n=1 Tax=Niallia circulans TaxID=1397 RepID=A0A941JJM7_NIACI|nr:hypothetical protein [Niallia circulans]MCB5235539.1 hypothetical protein [Niallia circulans]